MRRFVDLHTHSTASDGQLNPAELMALAEREQLLAVALTDHDTTAGLAEARKAAEGYPELRFIPGIEVSAAWPAGTLHILALGIDEDSPALADLAAVLRAARDERNPKIITKLQALGMDITMDDVAAQAPASSAGPAVLGRLHIAHAMVAKGYVRDADEAFDRYIGRGKPAYGEKDKLPPAQVIAAVRAAGGLTVLAHPPQLHYANDAQLETTVRTLVDAGLEAIEAYHSDHTDRQTRHYLDLARRFGLGVTGGSDFHGSAKPGVPFARPRVSVSMLTGGVAERLGIPTS